MVMLKSLLTYIICSVPSCGDIAAFIIVTFSIASDALQLKKIRKSSEIYFHPCLASLEAFWIIHVSIGVSETMLSLTDLLKLVRLRCISSA